VKAIVNNLTDKQIHFAALPEFLKEGTAVDDTLYPDRVVIGVENKTAFKVLEELHSPLKAPILCVKPESAQLAKYASNNYLALRIVYANALAEICENSEADINEVIEALGYEKRIGNHYWYPGLGYGGSCFPKDVKALAHFCQDNQMTANLFTMIDQLNEKRPTQVLDKISRVIDGFAGKKVAVLGLSFKANTDDQREAPALAVIPRLLDDNAAQVLAYDPMVEKIVSEEIAKHKNYRQVETLSEAVAEADLIIALIEWPQIVGFDFATTKAAKQQFFFDARGQFEMKKMQTLGYIYLGIGQKF
jgi:UDPglucose 6-dehydrogenase